MTTEFFRASERWTAGDVLEALRGFDEQLAHELDEVPVVTEEGKLVGMAPLIRLLRSAPDAPVTTACRSESASVGASATVAEVVDWFEKYHLRGLAVTDEYGRLVGLISVEDVLSRLARRE
jgi:magnesium transporter